MYTVRGRGMVCGFPSGTVFCCVCVCAERWPSQGGDVDDELEHVQLVPYQHCARKEGVVCRVGNDAHSDSSLAVGTHCSVVDKEARGIGEAEAKIVRSLLKLVNVCHLEAFKLVGCKAAQAE